MWRGSKTTLLDTIQQDIWTCSYILVYLAHLSLSISPPITTRKWARRFVVQKKGWLKKRNTKSIVISTLYWKVFFNDYYSNIESTRKHLISYLKWCKAYAWKFDIYPRASEIVILSSGLAGSIHLMRSLPSCPMNFHFGQPRTIFIWMSRKLIPKGWRPPDRMKWTIIPATWGENNKYYIVYENT